MRREELDRLLARYHTGELSAMERQRLIEASLRDQDIFDELMGEDGLREAMEDPVLREAMLEELNEAAEESGRPLAVEAIRESRRSRWLWPGMATAAAALVAVGLFLYQRPGAEVQVAQVALVPKESKASVEPEAPKVAEAGKAAKPMRARPSAPPAQVAEEVAKEAAKDARDVKEREAPAERLVETLGKKQDAALPAVVKDEASSSVVLSVQRAGGEWVAVAAGAEVERGVRLRATVTSPRAAMAVLEPAYGRAVGVRAGVPVEIELPTSESGEKAYTIVLAEPAEGRMDAAKAVAMEAAESDRRFRGEAGGMRQNESKSKAAPAPARPGLVIRYRVK